MKGDLLEAALVFFAHGFRVVLAALGHPPVLFAAFLAAIMAGAAFMLWRRKNAEYGNPADQARVKSQDRVRLATLSGNDGQQSGRN